MKRFLPFLIILWVVAGCTGGPVQSDADMATRVAQVLTSMPTNTGQPLSPSPVPTETSPAVVVVTLPPTDTVQPEETEAAAATDTLEPTQEPIEAPTQTVEATATPQATSAGGSPTPPPTLAPGGPTPTFPAGDPRLKLGSSTSTDPMNDEDTWVWPTGDSPFTDIVFKNGYLWLTGLTEKSGWRLPLLQTLPNMYIEMTANPGKCVTRDNYGIIFRVPNFRAADRGYLFAVACEGKYALWMWDGRVKPNGKATMLVTWKDSKAILKGPNQWNRVGVLTQADRITLYVNGVKLEEVSNSTYKDGAFGIFVNPADDSGNFTLQVDEMSYWLNPNQ